MGFSSTEYGPQGQALSGVGVCRNGHPNATDAHFCADCGVPMLPPADMTAQHERIAVQYPEVVNTLGTATSQDSALAPMPDERDRPNVMFLWLWLFVFSPVVLFLAPGYAKKAQRLGFRETGRYWVPWWLVTLGYALLAALIIVAANSPSGYNTYGASSTYTDTYVAPTTVTAVTTQSYDGAGYPVFAVTQESGDAYSLSTFISQGGMSWSAGVIASSAVCEPNTQTDVGWSYNCNITFDNGGTSSYWVEWSAGSTYQVARRSHG